MLLRAATDAAGRQRAVARVELTQHLASKQKVCTAPGAEQADVSRAARLHRTSFDILRQMAELKRLKGP